MPCNVQLDSLFEFADGELDLQARLAFETHYAACAECQGRMAQIRRMRADVQKELSVEFPQHLNQSLHTALKRELNAEGLVGRSARQAWWKDSLGRIAATIILTACLSIAGSMAFLGKADPKDEVAHEAVNAFRRAAIQDSTVALADTEGSRLHQWFAERSLISPAAGSFAKDGFPLLGGRLDFVDGRKVAALVYGHDAHRIDVFVWPEGHAGQRPEFKAGKDLNVAYWFSNGLEYWAVSDGSKEDIQHLYALLAES